MVGEVGYFIESEHGSRALDGVKGAKNLVSAGLGSMDLTYR
jgi:hypothetical protein